MFLFFNFVPTVSVPKPQLPTPYSDTLQFFPPSGHPSGSRGPSGTDLKLESGVSVPVREREKGLETEGTDRGKRWGTKPGSRISTGTVSRQRSLSSEVFECVSSPLFFLPFRRPVPFARPSPPPHPVEPSYRTEGLSDPW